MPPALSHTPPGRVFREGGEADAPVRRRRVLFVPGYDPEAGTRYRMLFARELIRHAKRFGLTRRDISRLEPLADLPGQRWTVSVATSAWSTETTYEVLRWDDIVLKDFARPLPVAAALLFCGVISSVLAGTMRKFFRLHWKFGGVILYPAVVIALVLAVSIGIGTLVASLSTLLAEGPGWGRAALALGVAGLLFAAFYPLGERWFVWHLMHDWVFNWQHGMGWRRDYDRRADRFARHLVEAVREGGADEVLVVGHSSGSTMAVDVVGRALQHDPSLAGRGRLSLLTIGSCVPIVALNPFAVRYRERMALLMTCPDLFWAEYQAPQDWINFIGFVPIRDVKTGLDPARCANPVVRSPLFRETVTEKTYREIVYRPFRMHFQFLMSNDRPGVYDYLMIVAGPLALETRVRLGDEAIERVLGPARERAGPSELELVEAEQGRLASGAA